MSNYDLDFPLKGTITKADVQKAHERLLDITQTVISILEKNSIRYTIVLGTLLGAIRHGGFIPWDMDVDLAILEEDYANCIACLRRELPEWLVLQDVNNDKNYCAFWTKVVDLKTKTHYTKYVNNNRFKFTGLHLDLFILKATSSENYRYDVLNDNLLYYKRKLDRQLMSYSEYMDIIAPLTDELSKLKRTNAENDKYYFLHFMLTDIANVFPT